MQSPCHFHMKIICIIALAKSTFLLIMERTPKDRLSSSFLCVYVMSNSVYLCSIILQVCIFRQHHPASLHIYVASSCKSAYLCSTILQVCIFRQHHPASLHIYVASSCKSAYLCSTILQVCIFMQLSSCKSVYLCLLSSCMTFVVIVDKLSLCK